MKFKKWYPDLIVFILFVITTVFTVTRYNVLPGKIPVHWNISGSVDRYGNTYWIFSGIVLAFLLYLLLSVVFSYAFKETVKRIDSTTGTNNHNYLFKANEYAGLTKLLLTLIPLTYSFSVTLFSPGAVPFTFVFLLFSLFILAAIISIIKAVQYLASYKTGREVSFIEAMVKYVGYYNPDDPRVFVEKQIGVGTTVNFATRGGKVFFVLFIALPILFILFVGVFLIIK